MSCQHRKLVAATQVGVQQHDSAARASSFSVLPRLEWDTMRAVIACFMGCLACSRALALATPLQLDVCNMKQEAAGHPSMTLRVDEDGTCTVSSATLQAAQRQIGSSTAGSGGCTAFADPSADSNAVLQISFPCTRQPFAAVSSASGPALNIWVDIQDGADAAMAELQDSLKELIQHQQQEHRQPQQKKELHRRLQGTSTPPTNTCNFTTLNPVKYYRRRPHLQATGYAVGSVPCQLMRAAAIGDAAAANIRTDAALYDIQDGLWVVPAAVEANNPPEAGSCNIALTVQDQAFMSGTTYPCILVHNPQVVLGPGCCYNPPQPEPLPL